MSVLIEALGGLAILTNAVVYGTDVFGAIVLRPAIAAVDDRTLTQLLGRIHQNADRRFPVIGAIGLASATAMAVLAVVGGHLIAALCAVIAVLALVVFLVIYNRVSKPVNTALTSAALADHVPDGVRHLQARWDSVINARVALQGIALVALCVGLAAASSR